MNKLEEYRDKLSDEYMGGKTFISGFDAAIALDLPVKFNAWYFDHYLPAITDIGSHTISEEGVKYLKSLKYSHPIQVEREPLVYQYWLENIFKYE